MTNLGEITYEFLYLSFKHYENTQNVVEIDQNPSCSFINWCSILKEEICYCCQYSNVGKREVRRNTYLADIVF